jgi:small conductance mechanosensitive channel
MERIIDSFTSLFPTVLDYAPQIVGAVLCFTATLFLAKFLSRLASRFSMRRTEDRLIATFIGRILWSIVFIIGCVIVLGILGLGSVSNKILAGAGLTTFVVGFALKDIGENFLAGVILAFGRPYREGSLIECDGIKGTVRSMSLRQTTVEVENGRIVIMPNSSLIKDPVTKYLHSDLDMRQEFKMTTEPEKARKAVDIVKQTITSTEYVLNNEKKPVKVIVDSLKKDKVKLNVSFWIDTKKLEGSKAVTKSEIMLKVFDRLDKEGVKFSG